MAQHHRYSSYLFQHCTCETLGTIKRPRWHTSLANEKGINQLAECADTFDISYSAYEILVTCQECGEELARFYADKEIDDTRAKVEVEVGEVVTADRVVAWVGYTYDRDMILITDEMLHDEAAHVLLMLLGDRFVPRDEMEAKDAARQSLTRPKVYVPVPFHYALIACFEREARWRLRRKHIKQGFTNRSLWFQDREVEAKVRKIVTAQTGTLCPGHYDYDGYDPAYLGGGSYHQLLACQLGGRTHGMGILGYYNYEGVLIYPADARRKE